MDTHSKAASRELSVGLLFSVTCMVNKLRVLPCVSLVWINSIQFRFCFGKIVWTHSALAALFFPLLIFKLSSMHRRAAFVIFQTQPDSPPEMMEEFGVAGT